MWGYCNPVDIHFSPGALEQAGHYVAGVSYALITYPGPLFEEAQRRLVRVAGAPRFLFSDVPENPDIAELSPGRDVLGRVRDCEIIVALGGGSVLDAAKIIALSHGDTGSLRELATGGSDKNALPIVAIPTTAGTGSEVTRWATLWDRETDSKFSVEHPSLYPRAAFIDPELTLSAPRSLTVSTGLDALSHALESIWNVNANPVSRALAIQSARAILDVLPRLAETLTDLDLRSRMAQASLLAGLAFSNTRTALAHNISYPITLKHGIPHGIACSFTLPRVMQWASGVERECDAALTAIFNDVPADGAAKLDRFLKGLGVSTDHHDYGIGTDEFEMIVTAGSRGQRGRNFIGSVPGSN